MAELTDETISKTLSYWLRHRPDDAGLTLDGAGWTDASAVAAALHTRLAIDFDRLIEVVEGNDKQRFEFTADLERIRARQGHSIDVALELTPIAPPAAFYHGTVDRFCVAIAAGGLKKKSRHHVHLSADAETAQKVGARRGTPVIFAVAAEAMATAGHLFLRTGNGVWLTDVVPPKFLTRL